eukprot:TRINITY_DN9206_c0_g1_i1.p1 TRINITY_DN9206_c0_g1~~TRINITY_DN9206_c0_g1_i1.p1  ORF type:complete len:951 (+),score=297.40 TRINITY_DN9206_c0_g1_i1:136-2988(+)
MRNLPATVATTMAQPPKRPPLPPGLPPKLAKSSVSSSPSATMPMDLKGSLLQRYRSGDSPGSKTVNPNTSDLQSKPGSAKRASSSSSTSSINKSNYSRKPASKPTAPARSDGNKTKKTSPQPSSKKVKHNASSSNEAFVRYCTQERPNVKKAHPDLNFIGLKKKLEEQWIKLTKAQRAAFVPPKSKTITSFFNKGKASTSSSVESFKKKMQRDPKHLSKLDRQRKREEAKLQKEKAKQEAKEEKERKKKQRLAKQAERAKVVDDLELDHRSAVAEGEKLDSLLPEECFLDAMMVVEFCRAFAPGLATDKLNHLTLEKLEAAILAKDQPQKIGEVVACLLISLMEIVDGPNTTEVPGPFGFNMNEAPVNAETASEVARQYLERIDYAEGLPYAHDAETIVKALASCHFVELAPQQQVQVLRYFCDQHFDNEHVIEVLEEHQNALATLRKTKHRLLRQRADLRRVIKDKTDKQQAKSDEAIAQELHAASARTRSDKKSVSDPNSLEAQQAQEEAWTDELETIEQQLHDKSQLFQNQLLGYDRHHNRYYRFHSRPGVYCFDVRRRTWSAFYSASKLDNLRQSLDVRGWRERALDASLGDEGVVKGLKDDKAADDNDQDDKDDKDSNHGDAAMDQTPDNDINDDNHDNGDVNADKDDKSEALPTTSEALISLARTEFLEFYTKIASAGFGCVIDDKLIDLLNDDKLDLPGLVRALMAVGKGIGPDYLRRPLTSGDKTRNHSPCFARWQAFVEGAKSLAAWFTGFHILDDCVEWDKSQDKTSSSKGRRTRGAAKRARRATQKLLTKRTTYDNDDIDDNDDEPVQDDGDEAWDLDQYIRESAPRRSRRRLRQHGLESVIELLADVLAKPCSKSLLRGLRRIRVAAGTDHRLDLIARRLDQGDYSTVPQVADDIRQGITDCEDACAAGLVQVDGPLEEVKTVLAAMWLDAFEEPLFA